jgi:GT2 family glycosyltransferase
MLERKASRGVDAPDAVFAGDLSVVIATYNCADHLTRCLASLADDGATGRYEVIVVDNESTDGTWDVAASKFPWVRAIAMGDNAGFSRACNRGYHAASGRYVLMLNPDTIVPPGALAAAVGEMDRDSGVGMLGVKLVQPDGALDHACKRGFPTPSSALAYFLRLHRLVRRPGRVHGYVAGAVGPDEVCDVDAVNGAFMLVRREAVDEVGLFDEDYWLYMEDLDWCYRFWQAGWRILYWPEVTVQHVKGGSSGASRTWRINKAFHRGMWMFYSKHYAPSRSVAMNSTVWLGIHSRLGLSATISAIRRRTLSQT